jgi:hypothetical protein
MSSGDKSNYKRFLGDWRRVLGGDDAALAMGGQQRGRRRNYRGEEEAMEDAEPTGRGGAGQSAGVTQ